MILKWIRNPSKRRLWKPSEPLGAHFGYRAYFETRSGVIFRGLGLPRGLLGNPWGLFGATFSLFFLSGRAQDSKMDAFLGDLFSDAFFYTSFYGFRGVPAAKTMDSVWEG